jgi:hypothetical protein
MEVNQLARRLSILYRNQKSQQSATEPYPKPDKSSPHLHNLFLRTISGSNRNSSNCNSCSIISSTDSRYRISKNNKHGFVVSAVRSIVYCISESFHIRNFYAINS